MYTITITNEYGYTDRSTKLEVATASEARELQVKFESINMKVEIQDDSDLNSEGCYDGGFYDEGVETNDRHIDRPF